MTYRQFIKFMMQETGLLREDAQKITEVVFDSLREALKQGDDVSIPRFGRFFPKLSRRKKWKSPSTKEVKELAPKYHLKLKPSRKFERALNDSLNVEVEEDDE